MRDVKTYMLEIIKIDEIRQSDAIGVTAKLLNDIYESITTKDFTEQYKVGDFINISEFEKFIYGNKTTLKNTYKGLLNDNQIKKLCLEQNMISPFIDKQVREVKKNNITEKVVSYGVSGYGYDITLADDFKIFCGGKGHYIDIKNKNNLDYLFMDIKEYMNYLKTKNPEKIYKPNEYICIPPNSFILARTNEYFTMPDDIFCIFLGKSTYARVGMLPLVTPMENGFKGHITLELANLTPSWLKVYINEGIAQALFFRGEKPNIVYGEGRKYQGQTGVTLPKI